jgi:hypothetical protein
MNEERYFKEVTRLIIAEIASEDHYEGTISRDLEILELAILTEIGSY